MLLEISISTMIGESIGHIAVGAAVAGWVLACLTTVVSDPRCVRDAGPFIVGAIFTLACWVVALGFGTAWVVLHW